MWKIIILLVCFHAEFLTASICQNPEVSASSYTSQDGTIINQVAFIAEFNLVCSNLNNAISLHAEVNGKLLPVVKVDDISKYQISWTEDVKKASSGEYNINLYDEEGYTALRKAFRTGDDPSSVKPLVTILVNFPGTYQGPWINSEFLAFALCVGVWYFAYIAKSKL